MFVLGLTGSIGMGKTTAAALFRGQRVNVYDADAGIHQLLAKGGEAVYPVAAAFPESLRDGYVDREVLGNIVFNNKDALGQLESILHPMVRKKQAAFLRTSAIYRRQLVVLDIPLLFETGGETICDAVAVVSAPLYLQRIRVLGRAGMTEEKLAAILARQIPDAKKRQLAEFVIPTGLGKRFSLHSIREIIRAVTGQAKIHGP